tara:strand:- start:710 stop:1135 length:426 start_codon:yes stop_codon:yes gene_type:complete
MNINDTNFQKTAIEGVTELNIISNLFLSEKNIKLIHLKIINSIREKYNYTISKQSKNELLIIMRSIYLNNCTNNVSDKNEIKKELIKLNDLVINYSVNNIIKNIKSHELYLDKINNNLNPIDLPRPTTVKGDKILELKPFF